MIRLGFGCALLPDGWARDVGITIDADGVIVAVEPQCRMESFDRRRGIVLPGMINLHSHAFQRGMAGLAERAGCSDDSFWTWRALMYRFLDHLTPDDIETIATLAYVEMLESGFTTCAEFHYLHHAPDGRPYTNVAETAERIAAAAATTGIGLTLLPAYYRYAGFSGVPPDAGQRRFICGPDLYARLVEASRQAIASLPGARIGVAPHSLRAVAAADLELAASLLPAGPIHIHAAEQEREVIDCLAWSGRRPVEWLLTEQAIGPRWCLVHATQTTTREVLDLAASGAVAGLCPVTEANLGDGVFATTDYWRAGGTFGIGTDSNILISVADELRSLEYAQRLTSRRRNRLAPAGGSVGRTLYGSSLRGGAQASARAVGAIAAGMQADLVVVDDDHPAIAGRDGDSVLDGLVFAAREQPIVDVWVAGRQVVCDGCHRHRDTAIRRFTTMIRGFLA